MNRLVTGVAAALCLAMSVRGQAHHSFAAEYDRARTITVTGTVERLEWTNPHARLYVKSLGWAIADDTVLFRSGWLWRELTIARFNKIQAVALTESPFDRRASMATVRVDTAAASAHRVTIPYLAQKTADDLYRTLAAHAARTAFRW